MLYSFQVIAVVLNVLCLVFDIFYCSTVPQFLSSPLALFPSFPVQRFHSSWLYFECSNVSYLRLGFVSWFKCSVFPGFHLYWLDSFLVCLFTVSWFSFFCRLKFSLFSIDYLTSCSFPTFPLFTFFSFPFLLSCRAFQWSCLLVWLFSISQISISRFCRFLGGSWFPLSRTASF